MAKVLEADLDELLLLADKVPVDIRERLKQRPDAFRNIAAPDHRALDQLLAQIGKYSESTNQENDGAAPGIRDRRTKKGCG